MSQSYDNSYEQPLQYAHTRIHVEHGVSMCVKQENHALKLIRLEAVNPFGKTSLVRLQRRCLQVFAYVWVSVHVCV